MSGTPGYSCRSAFVSHRGAVRKINEDAFLEAPDLGLWVVADGMGGHEGGQLASWMVIDALDRLPAPVALEPFVDEVRKKVLAVNDRLREIGERAYGGAIVGATIAVLLVFDGRGVCLWAGDSRIYLFRRNVLTRITTDHSRVQEMIASGTIDQAQAETHPLRNYLTRAVGAQEDLRLDLHAERLQDGDVFLLCSDGLTKAITDEEIEALLRQGDGADPAQRLLERCLARKVTDNVTIGLVQVSEST